MKNEVRPIYKIADDIQKDWKNVYFGARPYLNAMLSINRVTDMYGLEQGKIIVLYFLSNASTWRGETAKKIKNELKNLIK